MELEIVSKEENPLLGRREIEFALTNPTTPSRKEIRSELAKRLKTKEGSVIINKIGQQSGSNQTVGRAKAYDDEKAMGRIELTYRSKRGVKEAKNEEQEGGSKPQGIPKEAPEKSEGEQGAKPEAKPGGSGQKQGPGQEGKESAEKPSEEDKSGEAPPKEGEKKGEQAKAEAGKEDEKKEDESD